LSEYFFLSFFYTKGLNNPHPRGSKETEWVSRQLIRLAHFTCKINGEPSAAEINGSANNKSPFSASFSGPDRAQSAALWTRTRTRTRSRIPGFPEPGEPPFPHRCLCWCVSCQLLNGQVRLSVTLIPILSPIASFIRTPLNLNLNLNLGLAWLLPLTRTLYNVHTPRKPVGGFTPLSVTSGVKKLLPKCCG